MPRVMAVVPTFRPDPSVPSRVESLLKQAERVIVVDDGSPAEYGAVLDELERAGAEVIRSAENRGIAAALNVGTRRALKLGASHVATFDQDTWAPPEYLRVALGVFERANAATRIGVVASDLVNGHPAIPASQSPEGLGLVPEAIQSGMVISAECLTVCGLFDERLFIDCVDTEFCARVLRHGFRISIALGTNLRHALGEQVPQRPFGIRLVRNGAPRTYQYHSPYRRYFITRNNIDLCFRFARSRPRWVLTILRREVPTGIIVVVSGPRRIKHAIALLAGTVDGLLRRRGPMPAHVRRLLTSDTLRGAEVQSSRGILAESGAARAPRPPASSALEKPEPAKDDPK